MKRLYFRHQPAVLVTKRPFPLVKGEVEGGCPNWELHLLVTELPQPFQWNFYDFLRLCLDRRNAKSDATRRAPGRFLDVVLNSRSQAVAFYTKYRSTGFQPVPDPDITGRELKAD